MSSQVEDGLRELDSGRLIRTRNLWIARVVAFAIVVAGVAGSLPSASGAALAGGVVGALVAAALVYLVSLRLFSTTK